MTQVFKYNTASAANKKRAVMKRLYGYRPALIKVRKPGAKRRTYVVVKPSGLRRIDRL